MYGYTYCRVSGTLVVDNIAPERSARASAPPKCLLLLLLVVVHTHFIGAVLRPKDAIINIEFCCIHNGCQQAFGLYDTASHAFEVHIDTSSHEGEGCGGGGCVLQRVRRII